MVKKHALLLLFFMIVFSGRRQAPADSTSGMDDRSAQVPHHYALDTFVMGVDLSYVNQVLDHGGVYRDSRAVETPYEMFSEYGANVVRLRLWHNPTWTAEVYEGTDNPLYNNLEDVAESIRRAKEQGMAVSLDIHYSDRWADPEKQHIPRAWEHIRSLETLKDSVYSYTRQTLQYLNSRGLMPEFVQVGNETNCGLLFSDAPDSFPDLNVCEGHWTKAGAVLNSAIEAVREVSADAPVNSKIILHIAQPENVCWWFRHMTEEGGVTDFDIIGFSYYLPWSDTPLEEISNKVSEFRRRFDKEVMIVETAYPWTLDNADNYNNIFGKNSLVEGYPASVEGQLDFMTDLTQEVIDGGGSGIMYWEPAWITSDLKDKWGQGSSWENNTFFDFKGNVHRGIHFMTADYIFE